MNFLSASLSWRNGCRTLAAPSVPSDLAGAQPSISSDLLEASRNCDAVATLARFLNSATLRGGLLGRMTNAFNKLGGLMMIGSLTPSEQPTAIKEVFATSDLRTLVASHLGVSVCRVTDEAHFTDDLGADWLDHLELMMMVEDQFPGVEIADDEVDRIQVVGDLIRFIETMDNERRRRGVAPVIRNLFGPRLAHAVKSTKQQKGCEEVALFFLRVAGDAMRNLIGWCPETRQPIDLQLHVDDATLSRIWSNLVRFRCPHCGVKHETRVERLASRPFSLERPQAKRTRDGYDARCMERERLQCDA
jgi:acyl carrier protein